MSATTGWRRTAPGSYSRGTASIRRLPDPATPDRPWVLYMAQVPSAGGWAWGMVGRFHTLRLAQHEATRREDNR